MRRKSPVSRAVSRYENTPRGAEGSCGARLQSSVPVGAELTWSCSIIHHGLPPGSGSFPAGAGGTRSPRSPGTLRIPDRELSAHRRPRPAPPRPRSSPAASSAPPGGPAHLDPLHGGLQLQLLHQALHGAQAAGRRHDGAGRNGMERRRSVRCGAVRLGSAGTAGAARGRGRRRSAPLSDPRVVISTFHPRLRLFSFEMPLCRSLLPKNR